MFIYLIVNHETGKYYVGQHKGNNLKKYLQDKFSQSKYEPKRGRTRSYLFASMRKHSDPKVWSIHALRSDIQTKAELDDTERGFIRFLRSQDPEYGYNICRGGEGFTGPHLEETRKKMSIHSRLMWSKPEFRVKQSGAEKASWSDERRSIQSAIANKRWADQDFRSKLSVIQKEAQTRESVVLKKSQLGKLIWADLEKLAQRGKKIKAALSKPEEQVRRALATKIRWDDPDYRAKMAEMSKRLWANPDYRAKMEKRGKSGIIIKKESSHEGFPPVSFRADSGADGNGA